MLKVTQAEAAALPTELAPWRRRRAQPRGKPRGEIVKRCIDG
jgi:ribonuclease D